jgi:hypothetical protein
MALRLDELPRETQRQVLAALEQQGQLILDDGGPADSQEPTGHGLPLRTAAIVLAYAVLAVGLCLVALSQPSAAQGYPEFFARVVVYVVRACWAIVRENAVPLSGNLVIVIIFGLGVFQAAKLAVSAVRRFWPLLIVLSSLGIAIAISQSKAAYLVK